MPLPPSRSPSPLAGLAAVVVLAAAAFAQPLPQPVEFLVLAPLGQGGRSAVFRDPIAARLSRGTWQAPVPGEEIEGEAGRKAAWRSVRAGVGGTLADRALRGGWAVTRIESAREQVAILAARGHRHLFVDGAPRGGDPYDLDSVRVPVLLRAGATELLFQGSRGRIAVNLTAPPAPVFLEARDATLPDVLAGVPAELVAGILATNATTVWQRGLTVEAAGGDTARRSAPFALPPLGARKIAVPVPPIAAAAGSRAAVTFHLRDAAGQAVGELPLTLQVAAAGDLHRRTFVSGIDGSVQYYAVLPAAGAGGEPRALILSLHGAGVEASGQAACYAAKDWAHVVAPTNRRPYGFDWEDWGRIDAVEVLALAPAALPVDRQRVYLTGHSMGGHGTWNLGVHFAPRFAAIAPSAGWCDFWTYGRRGGDGEPRDAVAEILARAANPSRTLLAKDNLADLGVYVLHGDADDNVPVREARAMRAVLAEFHPDFAYREQPGAGHWWGNACVDWPPLLDFLRAHARPPAGDVDRVRFVCVSPGVQATSAWATVEAQQQMLQPSRIDLTRQPGKDGVRGTTENVARLALDPAALRGSAAGTACGCDLDGQTLEVPWPAHGPLRLQRGSDGAWSAAGPSSAAGKHPGRYGSFKTAFDHRVLLVVGTGGDAAENAWALAKARFDAETFWYRGNGALEILLDTDFDPAAEPDRSLVLYGNADTNRVWRALLGSAPITVARGSLRAGACTLQGDDVACLFVYPRPGSDVATVAAVTGTGLPGLRATDLAPYFVSGAGFPDWLVFGPGMLEHGAAGVRGAGFFAADWGLGESAWR